jgi:hypothetical protein
VKLWCHKLIKLLQKLFLSIKQHKDYVMSTKLKTLLMAMILAGFSAQHAVAENLNNVDMAFAFEGSAISTTDSAQMGLLSNEEMMVTEGEWLPLYVAYYYYGPTIGMYAAYGIGLYSRYNMGSAFSSFRNRW